MPVVRILYTFLLCGMYIEGHPDEACSEHHDAEFGSKGSTCKPLLQTRVQPAAVQSIVESTSSPNVPQATTITTGSPLPPVGTAVKNNDTDFYDLIVGATEVCLEDKCVFLRGFVSELAPGTIGPTIIAYPGEMLKIRLHNNLEEPSEKTDAHIGYLNHTNLHTHGLHVSGKAGQDHVLNKVAPGNTQDYNIEIPEDHMGGLHWYHPHVHHSTAFQAGGGLAGLLVVEDEKNAIPAWLEAMPEYLMMISILNLPKLREFAEKGEDGLKLHQLNASKDIAEQYELGISLVNGMHLPAVDMQAGQWIRLRMVYAAVEQQLEMKLVKNEMLPALPMADCELQLVAKDGIYLHEIPRKITVVHLFAGSRADFALRCACDGADQCSAMFYSQNSKTFSQKFPSPATHKGGILQVNAFGTEVAYESLGISMVTRPCYLADLRDLDMAEADKHVLKMYHHKLKWDDGPLLAVPDLPSKETDMPSGALGNLPSGKIIQIALQGFDYHPYHQHVQPFQIQEWAEEGVHKRGDKAIADYYKSGDWHDVLLHPTGKKNARDAYVRFVTDRFTGEMVIHCHTLEHEDEGMMGWLWITGVDGQQYQC